MSNVGRKRSLDDKKRDQVCAIIAAGAGIKTAARYVGCTVRTIYREAQRDEEFADRLHHSEAQARITPLSTIRDAAGSQWRAARWMLEHIDPERFGRRPKPVFGKEEARQLGRDLIKILRQEVENPLLRERLEVRFWAAIEYATRQSFDTERSRQNLRVAMEYFATKEHYHDPIEELMNRIIEGDPAQIAAQPGEPAPNRTPAPPTAPVVTE